MYILLYLWYLKLKIFSFLRRDLLSKTLVSQNMGMDDHLQK